MSLRKFNSRFIWLVLLGLLSLASLILGLLVGSVAVEFGSFIKLILGQANALESSLILDLRLPRVLAAFVSGALLAVAGLLMQVLLRNPLADPYILGLSGGSAVAALLALLAGWSMAAVSGAAFVGALISTAVVFGLANAGGQASVARLLLTGVVIASGWGAIISLVLATSPSHTLPSLLFWIMGDLSHAPNSTWAWVVLAVALAVLLPLSPSLNVLSLGNMQAAALGLAVARLEFILFIVSALLTAVAVTLAGSLGFVGLVIPHLMRLVLGTNIRWLLPASALAGGSLVVIADTIARSLLSPQQLPVGAITALIGVPCFLFLLMRKSSHV